MKKLLVIRASADIGDKAILDIYCHAEHYGIVPEAIEVNSLEDLKGKLNGKMYDYVYFAGHGNGNCFGDPTRFIADWAEIGKVICTTDCLNKGAIVMLYCCKGGLNVVAYQLFSACSEIEYICGAKQNMKNIDLIIGFNVFLYNIENRNIDPVLSAQKATLATEIRFECFDRTEVEANPLYFYRYCPDCNKDPEDEDVLE